MNQNRMWRTRKLDTSTSICAEELFHECYFMGVQSLPVDIKIDLVLCVLPSGLRKCCATSSYISFSTCTLATFDDIFSVKRKLAMGKAYDDT
ncbi:hypothetical protein RHMOL_Rhmol03G0084100 [Rhododendron molle]|uniref:Uncharacterized protein n=1 Tax=Rhododendron molle TaxID=49168 RepID=A0ACC0PD49_RHOML|nr:hypothetical protein RHMOL_Rhmol03G0084100 [Rhododendron molle]